MDAAFTLKLLFSFSLGGLWVTVATVIAERCGSKAGGVISGVPSIIVIALLFIGLSDGPERAVAATSVIPLTFAASCIFMLVYAMLVRRGLVVAIGAALSVWFALQLSVVRGHFHDFSCGVAICALTLAGTVTIFERILRVRSHGKVSVRYSAQQVAARAVFSGTMIAAAVLVSRLSGPAWGGVFAAFPAMFIATLIITYRAGGPDFSRSVCKAHMISGVINCVVYAAAVRYLFLPLGVPFATAIAFCLSVITSLATFVALDRWIG